ncbi:MAG: hypothetical protein O7D95_06525 [Betaproteobacteria bacterium]|nr:hypothetical protein [Betaproteobacteria bacterium]
MDNTEKKLIRTWPHSLGAPMDTTEKLLWAIIKYLGCEARLIETFCDVSYINTMKHWGEHSAIHGKTGGYKKPEKKDHISISYKLTPKKEPNYFSRYDFGESIL